MNGVHSYPGYVSRIHLLRVGVIDRGPKDRAGKASIIRGHDERSLRGFQTYGRRTDYTRDVIEY